MTKSTEVLTEKQIEKIAENVFDKKMKTLEVKIDALSEILQVQEANIARITRLLLGEEGITLTEDTLSHRARVAHQFASDNSETMMAMRDIKKWYEKWNSPQAGCDESNFEKLGKIIRLYNNLTWLVGLIGVVSIFNAIPVIKWIIGLIQGAI